MLATCFSAYLGSLVCYGILNSLPARHPAASVVPFTLLLPPVAMATAWLLQGDRPGLWEVAGGAVLMAGVGVTVLVGRRVTSAAPSATEVPRPVTV